MKCLPLIDSYDRLRPPALPMVQALRLSTLPWDRRHLPDRRVSKFCQRPSVRLIRRAFPRRPRARTLPRTAFPASPSPQRMLRCQAFRAASRPTRAAPRPTQAAFRPPRCTANKRSIKQSACTMFATMESTDVNCAVLTKSISHNAGVPMSSMMAEKMESAEQSWLVPTKAAQSQPIARSSFACPACANSA